MLKLRFYARATDVSGEIVVPEPDQQRYVGQPIRVVGREFVAATKTTPAGYRQTQAPSEYDFGSEVGQALCKEVRRSRAQGEQSLWPADEETARHCGVPFVKTKFEGGKHVPESAPARRTARRRKGGKVVEVEVDERGHEVSAPSAAPMKGSKK